MAIDTAQKREASLQFGRVGSAGTRTPTGTTSAFLRGETLGHYYQSSGTATVYPTGDGSIGDWTDETGVGTTNLWSHVDEAVLSPTDADYIQASTISSISAVFLLLGDMPGDFVTMGSTIVVKFRGRNLTSGDFGPVGIYQSDETTALTDTSTPATTGTLANYTLTLNVTGATSLAAWNGARLKFATDNSAACDLEVTAVQVDVTYSATAASTPGAGTNQNASVLLAM